MKFLIVGATGAVGSSILMRLRKLGHEVHAIARDHDKLRSLAEEHDISYSIADVLDTKQLCEAIQCAGDKLQGAAYCVGSIRLAPFSKLSHDDFLAEYRLNALGAVSTLQAALPALRNNQQSPSSIVLFSSVAANQGFSGHTSTAMAKGAIEALTLSLAAEFAPYVRVNCIAPSLLETPLSQKFLTSETMSNAIRQLHPLQRLGAADDVAALACFLLSCDASWITGQVIGIDGGRSTLRTKS
jgi:NAD(P)-dependent dehydrogenase (short-subunit alcohol dehydrogenase family)